MSGLDKQIVPIVLTKGMENKGNNKVGVPGELVSLNNAVFTTTERISKRNGYRSWAQSTQTGGTISAGASLTTRGNELLLGDGSTLYSYDSVLDTWTGKGTLVSPTASTMPGLTSGYSLAGYDCAVAAGGLALVAAEQWSPTFGWTSKGVVYSIVDLNTGNIVLAQTALATTTFAPKCIVSGSEWLLYYVDSSGKNTLKCIRVPISTPQTPGAAVTVTAGAGGSDDCLHATTGNYDVAYFNSNIYVGFKNDTGGTAITGYKTAPSTPSTVAASITTIAAGAANPVYGICVVGNRFNNDICFGFTTTTAAQVTIVNSALSVTNLSATTLDTPSAGGFLSVCGISTTAASSSITFYMSLNDASAGYGVVKDRVTQATVTGSYSVGGATAYMRGVTVAGKPYQSGTLWYLPLSFQTGSIGTWQIAPNAATLIANGSGTVVARLNVGTSTGYVNKNLGASGAPRQCGMLPESNGYGSGTFVFALGTVIRFSQITFSSTSTLYQTVNVKLATIALSDATYGSQKAELAQTALFSGAQPTLYDGASTTEHGFTWSPFFVTATQAGGGNIADGTYSYAVIYEWQDAQGIVHRSAPSVAYQITTSGGSRTVTLTIPTLRVTSKAGVLITVFRTAAAGTGTVYYRVNNTGGVSDALLNDTTVDSVTWADTLADASISSNPQLYTTGGVLQNDPPPPLISPVIHRNRVIGIDSTNRLSLPYSKQVSPGAPIEFSGFFTLNIDPRGGDCTALGSLDDKLIVFKQNRIFAITGQGPDSTGGQNDWSDAILVSSDVGCTAPKSVVVTPGGLMFQSQKGIYLLDRSMSCRYIGSPVEAYNGAAISAANLVPATNQVRFVQGAQTLVFDYFVGQWSTFTIPGTAAGACVWNSAIQHLRTDGMVLAEVVGRDYDISSTFIAMSFTTSWIAIAGLQGFQRVRRLLLEGGKDHSSNPSTITVTIASDFGNANTQTATFNTTSTTGTDGSDSWRERIHFAQQKSEAIQLTFTDSQNGADYSSYLDLTAITLEVATKRGAYKLPAAQST